MHGSPHGRAASHFHHAAALLLRDAAATRRRCSWLSACASVFRVACQHLRARDLYSRYYSGPHSFLPAWVFIFNWGIYNLMFKFTMKSQSNDRVEQKLFFPHADWMGKNMIFATHQNKNLKVRKSGALACVCIRLHRNTHICWQLSCRTCSIWPSPAALMEPAQVTGRKWLDQRECGSVCHTVTHRWERYRSEVACGCWWVIPSWYGNDERRRWSLTGHARPFNAAAAWMSNCAYLIFFYLGSGRNYCVRPTVCLRQSG